MSYTISRSDPGCAPLAALIAWVVRVLPHLRLLPRLMLAASCTAAGGGVDANGGDTKAWHGNAGGAAADSSHDAAAGSGTRMTSDAASLSTGTLPAISDPALAGSFSSKVTLDVGPNGDFTTIAPAELGRSGIKHPIVIWAGTWPAIYQTLLNHIASHGFVIVAHNATPEGPDLLPGIDWIVAESKREGSVYFGTVDTSKIAAAGQSAGSLATFKIANDPRLTTTLHINGGTFDPHTDVMNLSKPALFICGDDPNVTGGDGTSVSDAARPNCDIDFENATTPVWYGDVIGASHTTVIDSPLGSNRPADDPLMKAFLGATVAWLRWQLADDETMRAMFVGPSCGFCTQTTAWHVQQKNLR